MRAVLRVDHVSHLGGVIPSVWQATPCERAGKATEGGRDLAFQGLTSVALDGATLLIKAEYNIAQASHLLFPLLYSWAPHFEETLDWIQFAYTADRTGAYVAPASTVLVPSAVSEGDPLFQATWRHLLHQFPGAYALNLSTISPLVVLHLFSTAGRYVSAVAELLCLIEILEELHTEVQGMITSPHLATTLLYHV